MGDFQGKKDRAQKMRRDHHRDKSQKHSQYKLHVEKNIPRAGTQTQLSKSLDSSHKETDEPTEVFKLPVAVCKDVQPNVPSFSKRKLVSNWDRYEENMNCYKSDDDAEADVSGAQFEKLLSMPTSGGHFKLKHEHDWDKEKSELQLPWFQLDIQTVEKNLVTIPFIKRQSLPRTIFTESQLQRMEARAKQNATSLSEISENILKLQSLGLCSNIEHNGGSEAKVKSSNQTGMQIKCSSADANLINENQELDELLALHESPLKNSPTKSAFASPSNQGDLQNDIPVASPANSPQPATSVTKPPLPPSSDDQSTVSLDDWLDSILDD